MSEAVTEDEIWTVFDSNARQGPRTHEVKEGVSYDLHAGKPTEMPRSHAAIFLRDPAFRVMNAQGVRLTPLPQAEADAAQARKLALASDETVAKFAELTDAALLARVASRPGGDYVAVTGNRDQMIAFLLEAPRVRELARHERARDTSMPDGDDDPDAALMGDDRVAKAMLLRDGSIGARDPLAMGA